MPVCYSGRHRVCARPALAGPSEGKTAAPKRAAAECGLEENYFAMQVAWFSGVQTSRPV